MSDSIDVNVIQRWESLGLLEGLPIWEKEELAQVYDNATRLLLSDKVGKNVFETYSDVYIPICRRLYRRVGINFNIETMMSKLLEEVNKVNPESLKFDKKSPEKNPVIEFCINFADSYEDDITNINQPTKEEYESKVEKLLLTLKEVLLCEKMVSFVNRENSEWEIKHSEVKKSTQQVRYWNQKIGKQLLTSVLSDINKGI
jgi:hypothetical protein